MNQRNNQAARSPSPGRAGRALPPEPEFESSEAAGEAGGLPQAPFAEEAQDAADTYAGVAETLGDIDPLDVASGDETRFNADQVTDHGLEAETEGSFAEMEAQDTARPQRSSLEDVLLDAFDDGGGQCYAAALLQGLDALPPAHDDGGLQQSPQSRRVIRMRSRTTRRNGRPRLLPAPVLQLLRDCVEQGLDDAATFAELSARHADEGDAATLPVMAGIAVQPLLRQIESGSDADAVDPRPQRRLLLRAADEAARRLAHADPAAVRSLPRLVRSVCKAAQRRQLTAENAVPAAVGALRRGAVYLSRHPQLVRRLARPVSRGATTIASSDASTRAGERYRLRIPGPIEILISRY